MVEVNRECEGRCECSSGIDCLFSCCVSTSPIGVCSFAHGTAGTDPTQAKHPRNPQGV